jgi:polar amino acid transport system permease protein
MSAEDSLLIKSLPLMLQGCWITLQIAFLAICLGLCGGICMGILNCNKLRSPLLGAFLNGFVWVIRGTPLFVQVLIIYYALPELLGYSLSPFAAGVVALGANSTAYISEIVRGSINALPEGQWEAAYVVGLNTSQTLQGIILPQMVRICLPGLINELTSLIKETSTLTLIGVAELTKVSRDIVARELDPMTIYLAAAAIYFSLTSCLSYLGQSMQYRGKI